MIDFNKKLDKIEKSCYETAKIEHRLLKEENDNIISEKVLNKVDSYKNNLVKKYSDEINKIDREYNKNIFDYEVNKKKEINEVRENLIQEIENEVIESLKRFVDTPEYEQYLKRITSNLELLFEEGEFTIYLTEKDYEKYCKNYMNNENMKSCLCVKKTEKSYIKIDKISNDYIGGAIIVDEQNKVSRDNTIKTNIEQEIKKIKI